MTVPLPHILAGDDSPEILVLLRELLETEGYRVTATGTALTLAEVETMAPDLVIVDHMFEDNAGSGWELLRELRQAPATRTLPVVICTGAIQQVRDGQAELETLGAEVVLKPFDIETLLSTVRRALARC